MTLNVMWPNYTLCSVANTTCGASDIMHNNALCRICFGCQKGETYNLFKKGQKIYFLHFYES